MGAIALIVMGASRPWGAPADKVGRRSLAANANANAADAASQP